MQFPVYFSYNYTGKPYFQMYIQTDNNEEIPFDSLNKLENFASYNCNSDVQLSGL